MSEYQRFVSYLYEYQDNHKAKNCGFSRVEVRNRQCRIEIHMKLSPCPYTPEFQVYVFVPENDRLPGISLGKARYHQGTVYGLFTLPLENIGGYPWSFQDLGGLLIRTDSSQIFATTWKEIILDPRNFIPADAVPQVQAASLHDAPREQPSPEPSAEPALKSASESVSESSAPDLWTEIQETYPPCQPFFDDEIHQCVKLSPQDIPILAQKSFPIGSNQFLNHQCQAFCHFILGKMQKSREGEYVLAVPGTYSETEHFLAGMFGFPNFKPARDEVIRPGQFGYWYRIIC